MNEKYIVTLSACGNIDHGENPFENIVDGMHVNEGFGVSDTIEGCQQIVRTYIEDKNLGSGNWSGGYVFKSNENDKNNTFEQVGSISYNGRYWKKGSEFYHDMCEDIKNRVGIYEYI